MAQLESDCTPERNITRRDVLKRGATAAAAGAACAVPLLAPRGAAAAPGRARAASSSVTVWGFGISDPLGHARVEAFKKAYPTIALNVVPDISDQKILTAVASGDVPDIFWLDRSTIASWAARGALEPIDDLVSKSNVKLDEFYPAALSQVKYNGHIYAIPQFMDVRPLWINLDPLKQAGVALSDVQSSNWDKLRAAGVRLTLRKGSKISRWGYDTKPLDAGYFWMYCWANGGELLSADSKHASFDDPRNVETLQYLVDVMKSQGGFAAHKAFGDTWGWEATHPFILNQVAITPYENWLLAMISRDAPNHNFVVVPFRGRNGNPVSYTAGPSWSIPKGAGNRDAAWTFITFMQQASTWKIGAAYDKAQEKSKGGPFIPYLTANKVMDQMLQQQFYHPTNAKWDSAVKLFPTLLAHGRSWPTSPVITQLNDILISQAVGPALLGTVAPGPALKAAQAKAQQAIDSFHG